MTFTSVAHNTPVNNTLCSPSTLAQLRAILEQGLPLVARPYLAIAHTLGVTEDEVINTIEQWQNEGLIKRFGMVVRHRKLGYVANAMVVWNITDADVNHIAQKLAGETAVTLCYRRPRVLPHWPYNLFCMIHGKNRQEVEQQLADICQRHSLTSIEKKLLFSTKAYKQHGARYQSNPTTVNGVTHA